MISYQGQYERCQKRAQDFTAAALVFFKDAINDGKGEVESAIGIYHIEDNSTDLTEVGVDTYPLPARCVRLKTLYVTVGGRRYVMGEENRVYDEDEWQGLKASYPSETSDFLQKIFVRRNTVEFYPTPATAGNTIKMFFESSPRDLTQADYTTGTITTLANGTKAVVFSGTALDDTFVGRVLQVDAHKQTFEIASVTDATHATLVQDYDGVSISAGTSTFRIGEVMRTPESTHILPVYYALWQYYLGYKQSAPKAKEWFGLWDKGLKTAKALYGKRYSSNYIAPQQKTARVKLVNPNLYPGRIT